MREGSNLLNLPPSGDPIGVFSPPSPLPDRPPPPFDPGTEARLNTLRPDTQALARRHLQNARDLGLDPRIRDLGGARTRAGQIRAGRQTAIAARPGNSPHEYGAGYDITLLDETGRPVSAGNYYGRLQYEALQQEGLDLGLQLGPPGDYGHFELPQWRQLPGLSPYSGPQL